MNNNMSYFLNNAKMIEFYEELYEKLSEEVHGNKYNIEEIKEKIYNSYLNKLDNGYFNGIAIEDFSLFRVFLNGSMLLTNKEKIEEEGFRQLVSYYEDEIFNNPQNTKITKYISKVEKNYPGWKPIDSFYKNTLNSSQKKLKIVRNSFAHMQYGDFTFDSGGTVSFFKVYNYDKRKTAEGIIFEPIFNEFVEMAFSNNPNKGIAYNQSYFLRLHTEGKNIDEYKFCKIRYRENKIEEIIRKLRDLSKVLTSREVKKIVNFLRKNIKSFDNLKNNEIIEVVKKMKELSEELTNEEVDKIIDFLRKNIKGFENLNYNEIEEIIKRLQEISEELTNKEIEKIIKFLKKNIKDFDSLKNIEAVVRKLKELSDKLTSREVNSIINFLENKKNLRKFGNLKYIKIERIKEKLKELANKLASRNLEEIEEFFENNKKYFYLEKSLASKSIDLKKFDCFLKNKKITQQDEKDYLIKSFFDFKNELSNFIVHMRQLNEQIIEYQTDKKNKKIKKKLKELADDDWMSFSIFKIMFLYLKSINISNRIEDRVSGNINLENINTKKFKIKSKIDLFKFFLKENDDKKCKVLNILKYLKKEWTISNKIKEYILKKFRNALVHGNSNQYVRIKLNKNKELIFIFTDEYEKTKTKAIIEISSKELKKFLSQEEFFKIKNNKIVKT